MLFAVTMNVSLPLDLHPAERTDLLAREKAYSQAAQQDGRWPHIWRIAGQYANLSILDVASNEELHELLWNLPLFPYMTIDVQPLARHGSDVNGPP